VNLAEYVRDENFCSKYRVDPDAIFLLGHSMGGHTIMQAARALPWLRGTLAITPYDPAYYLKMGQEELLRELLQQGKILHSEGVEAIFQDILAHRQDYGFENAFEALKEQNIFCAAGSKDACAPADIMFRPLWDRLQAYENRAVQRFVEYPAGHGLFGFRTALIRDMAQFLRDVLEKPEQI